MFHPSFPCCIFWKNFDPVKIKESIMQKHQVMVQMQQAVGVLSLTVGGLITTVTGLSTVVTELTATTAGNTTSLIEINNTIQYSCSTIMDNFLI